MREFILEWLKRLEFMTGLKQFREMSPENAILLLDCLEEKVNTYNWMTQARLNDIMRKGMEGGYGDFFSINVRTLSTWCNTYQRDHQQLLLVENFPRDVTPDQSPEEIEFWTNKAREMFIECWEKAKKGEIRSLAEWIPTNYQKFIDIGLLKEDKYRFDEKFETQMMRRQKGLGFSASMLVSKKKEMIWRQFVKEMVDKDIDLVRYYDRQKES